MPHDRNGIELKVGDKVFVPMIVEFIYATEKFCNTSLVSEIPMYPGETKSHLTVNTKQVEKAGSL